MVQHFLQCISNVSVNHLVMGLEFVSKEEAVGGSGRGLRSILRSLTGHRKWLAREGNWIQWCDL